MENMASVLETLKEVEDRAASSLGVEQVFLYRLPTISLLGAGNFHCTPTVTGEHHSP